MTTYIQKKARNLIAPIPEHGAAVTPHDTNDLSLDCVLYIGGAGTVKILTANNETLTFVGLNAGDILPVKVRRVYSTDTTATNIVALW